MPNKNIGLRIDDDLLTQVDALAEQLGQTRTAIITEALHHRLGMPGGGSVEQRLTEVEQRLATVERLLGEVGSTGQAKTKPPTRAKVAPKQPREDAQQTASAAPPVSGQPPGAGLGIGQALLAAGAPLTEAQATGGNHDAIMQRRGLGKAAQWLEALGWVKRGRRWYPPGA